jgi:hypothetical protein
MARERGVAWLEGAGQSIEQETPYRAWRDVLAAHFDLGEGTDRSERGRQVAERVTEVNPAFAERVPLLNDVLRLDLPETDLTRGFDPKLRHESLTALAVSGSYGQKVRSEKDLFFAEMGPATQFDFSKPKFDVVTRRDGMVRCERIFRLLA